MAEHIRSNTLLNLSTDSDFYTDWKQMYQLDTEQTISNPYPTEKMMPSITRLISNLSAQFRLSHSIEFSTIDTMEMLVVRIIAGGENFNRDSFLQHIPLYVVAVISVVSKHFDARFKLDRQLMLQILSRSLPKLVCSDKILMELEFTVLKLLNYKIIHSLLLGAVERFSKDYILTLGIVRKDRIASIGIKLLRVVYAQKRQIYESLRSSVKSEEMFVRFKSNKLILAAAIVTAILSFCDVDQQKISDLVINPLSDDCFVEPKNIVYLRDAIVNVFK
ncbi:uncharacterized protein LOC129773596 [Toxorhynchites rutilus septentrionalis]|uniref:uncharacterized protein LOC129773596 n=1 Tax=Toxorhynchites rutilus septentrionalis TaxID=329112 RepID=UPI002479AA6D|nr:uncharacterized protein LOC129773596 [Toxorhynchites rutilus septentrionalis]